MTTRSNMLTLYDVVGTDNKTLQAIVGADAIRIVSEHLPIKLQSQQIDLYDIKNSKTITDVVGTLTGLLADVLKEPKQRQDAIAVASDTASKGCDVLRDEMNARLNDLKSAV